MLSNIQALLKKINFKLFLALLMLGLIPTIYTTFRIFLIGQLPGDWGFNIASQLAWVHLLYEVLQEAIILPLFFFIGAVLKDKLELENRIRTGALFTGAVYGALSLLILIFAVPLIRFMAQDVMLIEQTATYIRLETVAAIFITMVKFFIVVLVVINKQKYLYYVLGLKMVLSMVIDTFFVSTLDISLNLGVNGIAYTNIIVNAFLLVLVYFILKKEGIHLFSRNKMDFTWIKQLSKVGGISGLESFVRNFAFMMMVIRMVNVVGEQGTFWVANSFIWGWLLLPVMQLGELVKRDCSEEQDAIKEKTLGYFTVTLVIVVLWLASIPLWTPFLRDVLRLSNHEAVYRIALVSLGFYIMFAFNNVIDSVFYGIGKTQYMLFQSVVINSLFYGTLFILYITGVYQPTLMLIAIMFAAGIAFDSLLTYGIFVWMLRRRNIKIAFA